MQSCRRGYPGYFVHFSRFGVSCVVKPGGHVDSETFDFSLINLDPTSPVGNVVSFFFILFILIYLKIVFLCPNCDMGILTCQYLLSRASKVDIK